MGWAHLLTRSDEWLGETIAFDRIRFRNSLRFCLLRRDARRLYEYNLCAQNGGADGHRTKRDDTANGQARYGAYRAGPYPHLQGGKYARGLETRSDRKVRAAQRLSDLQVFRKSWTEAAARRSSSPGRVL